MMSNDLIALLRTGKFTVAYHDNGSGAIYQGHVAYEDLPEEALYEFGDNSSGYIPEIVELLTKALKGTVQSI